MNKILLEDIQRIHEIMGVSGKKLIMEGLPTDLFTFIQKSVIGNLADFGKVITNISSNVPYNNAKTVVTNLYNQLLANGTEEASLILNAIENMKKLGQYNGVEAEEIFYRILQNEDDLERFTDELTELKIDFWRKTKYTPIMSHSLDDLINKKSWDLQQELIIAAKELETVKASLEQLHQTGTDIKSVIERTKTKVDGFNVSDKVKDFYKRSLDEIFIEINPNAATQNISPPDNNLVNSLQDAMAASTGPEAAIAKADVRSSKIFAEIKKIMNTGLNAHTDEVIEKVTKQVISKMYEKIKGYSLASRVTPQEQLDAAEKALNSMSSSPVKLDNMIDEAIKEVNPRYMPNNAQFWLNWIKGATPWSGSVKGPLDRWKNFVIMNATIQVTVAAIDAFLLKQDVDWDDFEGDSDVEKIWNLLGGGIWAPIRALLPFQSGLLLKLLVDYRGMVKPSQEKLLKFLGPNGKKWYNAQADINIQEPQPDWSLDEDETACVYLSSGGAFLGCYQYDTGTDKLISVKSGDAPYDNYENAPSDPNSNSTSSTTGYEPKLESFKKWLTDKGKTESGPKGPDQYGVFQNGVVDYEFKDSKTGFDVTDKVYQQQ